MLLHKRIELFLNPCCQMCCVRIAPSAAVLIWRQIAGSAEEGRSHRLSQNGSDRNNPFWSWKSMCEAVRDEQVLKEDSGGPRGLG